MAFQSGFEPVAVTLQIILCAADQQAVAHPATRLHHLGGGQVLEVHQYSGCQAVEIPGAIRLVGQHSADAQFSVTEFQWVADLQVQGIEQARLDPDCARLWNAVRDLLDAECVLAGAHFTAQGIAGPDGLDAR